MCASSDKGEFVQVERETFHQFIIAAYQLINAGVALTDTVEVQQDLGVPARLKRHSPTPVGDGDSSTAYRFIDIKSHEFPTPEEPDGVAAYAADLAHHHQCFKNSGGKAFLFPARQPLNAHAFPGLPSTETERRSILADFKPQGLLVLTASAARDFLDASLGADHFWRRILSRDQQKLAIQALTRANHPNKLGGRSRVLGNDQHLRVLRAGEGRGFTYVAAEDVLWFRYRNIHRYCLELGRADLHDEPGGSGLLKSHGLLRQENWEGLPEEQAEQILKEALDVPGVVRRFRETRSKNRRSGFHYEQAATDLPEPPWRSEFSSLYTRDVDHETSYDRESDTTVTQAFSRSMAGSLGL